MEDASDDLLLVEDESAPIPFVVGEVFVHFNMEEAKVNTVASHLHVPFHA